MSRRRPRTASVSYQSDYQQIMPALGIVPLRPSPTPSTIVQNLAASLIGNIQEDIRCACHVGESLYTGDTQGTVLQWNPLDATRTTFLEGLGAPLNVLVGVNENKDIWAGLANGSITILNLDTKSIKSQMTHAHDAAVNCITAGIRCAWSGGDDFLIKKWDLDGVELFAYNHHHGFIKDVLILRNDPIDNHIKLWGASSDANISVSALQDNHAQHTLLSNVKMLSDHSKGVAALCLVGADAIWSGCEDGSIAVWSSLGVLKRQIQQAHKGPVGSFVVMGAHVWSGSGDRTVLVWESSSYRLLFSLGDQGGFIKAMVRVDYMCWVFASGKNVRIWCAQSVWDTYESEKNRLNRNQQRLKESLEKALMEKQSLESAKNKSEQDLHQAQQQMNEQRNNGASAIEKTNAEKEKLTSELAKTLKDLEMIKENTQQSVGDLDGEIKILLEKLSKFKAEKEVGEKAAKTKVQDLEKNLEKLGEEHKRDLENMEKKLQTAQEDLRSLQKTSEDMVVKHNMENQSAAELEKSLTAMNDKNKKLESLLARSIEDKKEVDKMITDTQVRYEQARVDSIKLEERIKQLQEDLDKAQVNANVSLTSKDAEMKKLQGELKKKSKELKKTQKEMGEDKSRSAKELEELKDTLDKLTKSQDASSSIETFNNEKLSNIAMELQNANDDLQKALRDKAEKLEGIDMEMQKMRESHLKSTNDLHHTLKELQLENENLQEMIRENKKDAEVSKETYQQACGVLEDGLMKTTTLLDDATKKKDEAEKDVADLRQKLQQLEQNMKQAKESADANDASSNSLIKERNDLLKRLNDAASETEKLKNELSELSQSVVSQAYALDELNKTGEKELIDFQESKKKQADLGKRLEDEQMKNSKELAKISDVLDISNKEKVKLEELLAQASAEIDKLKLDNSSQEYSTEQVTQELDQLKKEKTAMEQDLNQIRKEKTTQDDKLIQNIAELQQTLQNEASQQSTTTNMLEEIEELKSQKSLLEDKLSTSVSEIEELKKARRSQEEHSTQNVMEFDKMMRELEELRCETKQKEEEFRLRKENVVLTAIDATSITEELRNKIMKLEDTLSKANAATSVDDNVWKRIRELETALTQAHVDYQLLNREVRDIRKKRGRYKDDPIATSEIKPHLKSDGLEVDFRMIQPGFSIDYTKLKVSSNGNQGRTVTNTVMCGQTPNPGTPQRIIPIRPPISHPETSQRIIPIRTPSPALEMIEPIVVTPHIQSYEKERYFPSHGPMRIRRGLSPARER